MSHLHLLSMLLPKTCDLNGGGGKGFGGNTLDKSDVAAALAGLDHIEYKVIEILYLGGDDFKAFRDAIVFAVYISNQNKNKKPGRNPMDNYSMFEIGAAVEFCFMLRMKGFCQTCNGTGWYSSSVECHSCEGTGSLSDSIKPYAKAKWYGCSRDKLKKMESIEEFVEKWLSQVIFKADGLLSDLVAVAS